MGTLQRQIHFFAQAQRALHGVVLAGLVAFYALVFRPSDARLRQLNEAIASTRSQIKECRDRTNDLPAITRDVEALKLSLRNAKQLVPQADMPKTLGEIAQYGHTAGLKSFRYEPDAERPDELFREQPIDITFEGDFMSAVRFLRDTEQMSGLTRVRRMVLKNANPRTGQVLVELSMHVYLAGAQ
jgi:Tfp pilus assembly protein PilO